MCFYDSITFDIDFLGVRFWFYNSFYSFMKHRKNMTFMVFMALNGPSNW